MYIHKKIPLTVKLSKEFSFTAMIFKFDGGGRSDTRISYNDIIKAMDKEGYRPASFNELQIFYEAYPYINESEKTLFSLDTSWGLPNSPAGLCIPGMSGVKDDDVVLAIAMNDFYASSYFLGIHK